MDRAASKIKEKRQELKWTQAVLAKRLSVSQALISKWEKEGEIPEEYRKEMFHLLGIDATEDQMFESQAQAEAWNTYLGTLIKYRFHGANVCSDRLSEYGTSYHLAPLDFVGVTIPAAPTIILGNHEDPLDGFKFENQEDEIIFKELLGSALENLENIATALNWLLVNKQITMDDLESLWEEEQYYAWSQAITEFSTEIAEQAPSYVAALNKLKESKFEDLVEATWINSYKEQRNPNSELYPMMWTLPLFYEIVTYGEEADSIPSVIDLIKEGKAPDTFMNETTELQKITLNELSRLHDRINNLEALLSETKHKNNT